MNEKNRDDQSERVRGRSLALDESSDFESDEENVFVNPYIDRKIGVTKKRNVFVEERKSEVRRIIDPESRISKLTFL